MTIPTKTALGNEELRSRAQRLGQRHRTILFLIDGRRSLSEVLSLGQQAGSATSHFEDLVRLGMVEMPAGPPPAVEAEADLDAPLVTSLELEVPAVEPVVADDDAAPNAVPAREPAPPPVEQVEAVVARRPEPPVLVTPLAAEPPATPPAAPARKPAPMSPPVLGEDVVVPTADAVDAALLQRVRELLIDTLRLDAPMFSARTFVRVRSAQTSAELIQLAWEIETHMMRARHGRRELLSLERARELLGLGNTLVADDDSRPPYLDE
ncbi:MAG TPA: hypothetical protein VGP22_11620 [Albitalea sp.]|jgi:hypothetical protein|nr:hypothetical protein [Albitalea sp.]